jgi:hydrogenase expression/formation protein HypC
MCIGVPMRIVLVETDSALCEGRGRQERLDTRLLGELAADTWVLAYRGAAIRVMTEEEAAQTTSALDALDAVLAGNGNVDAYFADLVDREPQLPPHLKGNR